MTIFTGANAGNFVDAASGALSFCMTGGTVQDLQDGTNDTFFCGTNADGITAGGAMTRSLAAWVRTRWRVATAVTCCMAGAVTTR